jgi:hypothetical protein
MKKLFVFGLVTALCTLGCEDNKSAPGGPGANAVKNNPRSNVPSDVKHDTFKVVVPMTETSIKQGEQKDVTISIDREKMFKGDVTLKLSTEGKGITITPSTATLKADESNTKLKFTVAANKDAAIGEHVITITAEPSEGVPTTATYKVTVKGA